MKQCIKCNKTFSHELFYKQNKSKDGLNPYCKICYSEYNRLYVINNPDKIKAKNARRTKNTYQVQHQLYAENNYKRQQAHNKICYALKTKKIEKYPCFECGNIKSEAHHADYDNPLSVTWLCKTHHMQVHREYNNNLLKALK